MGMYILHLNGIFNYQTSLGYPYGNLHVITAKSSTSRYFTCRSPAVGLLRGLARSSPAIKIPRKTMPSKKIKDIKKLIRNRSFHLLYSFLSLACSASLFQASSFWKYRMRFSMAFRFLSIACRKIHRESRRQKSENSDSGLRGCAASFNREGGILQIHILDMSFYLSGTSAWDRRIWKSLKPMTPCKWGDEHQNFFKKIRYPGC